MARQNLVTMIESSLSQELAATAFARPAPPERQPLLALAPQALGQGRPAVLRTFPTRVAPRSNALPRPLAWDRRVEHPLPQLIELELIVAVISS